MLLLAQKGRIVFSVVTSKQLLLLIGRYFHTLCTSCCGYGRETRSGIGTSVDNLIVWRAGHLALRLNPRDWHREANLTEDFPVRLRARRKRQDPRNERLLQSIATVLINSRCSRSTQKVSRSCLKNVAQSRHPDEHHRHCLVCSIPCDRSRAACSDPVCHPRNALHEMCFQRSDPFSASATWKRCTCCTTVVAQPRSDAFDATGSMFSRRRDSVL